APRRSSSLVMRDVHAPAAEDGAGADGEGPEGRLTAPRLAAAFFLLGGSSLLPRSLHGQRDDPDPDAVGRVPHPHGDRELLLALTLQERERGRPHQSAGGVEEEFEVVQDTATAVLRPGEVAIAPGRLELRPVFPARHPRPPPPAGRPPARPRPPGRRPPGRRCGP